MKRVMLCAFVVIASASCSSAIRWEKPGVGESERQRDETDCTARASRESNVPSAQNIGTTPGIPNDPTRTRVQPYDPSVFEECMTTRGYKRAPAGPPA
jgi:hypothetical protein